MIENYEKRLSELGFAHIEIEAVTLVLMRMGVVPVCVDHRPRFIECYEFSDDGAINGARWQKAMREIGFRPDAIALAEHAIFDEKGSVQ